MITIKRYWGETMIWLKNYFSIDIALLIVVIGAYMAFIQGKNLSRQDDLKREGRFSQVIGYLYLIVGILGIMVSITH